MSTPSTTPVPAGTSAGPGGRAVERWRVAGLAVLGAWALLLALAIALWVRIAAFPGPGDDVHGNLRLLGAPFALLAAGILWWVWRSARHLRHHRREGWTLLLALGGVALAQSVVTAMPVALSSPDPGWEAVAPLLAGAGLGAVSLTVGLLGRRSCAHLDDPVSDRD